MINRRTRSRPAIAHSPGMGNADYHLTNPCWERILRISAKTKSRQPHDTEIVLCNNLKHSVAESSLRSSGIKYTALGKEVENWDNMYKVRLVLDHIKRSKSKNILYVDSSDVVLVGDLFPCVELFKNTNCEILLGSELKFYPRCPSLFGVEDFEKTISPNDYFALSAGCWIGRTEYVREILEEILEMDVKIHVETNRGFIEEWRISKSDQFRWHIMYHKHHPKIKLDHDCLIFQNIFLHGPGDLGLDML